MNIQKTAFLLSEMQNDYLHSDGAYGRADIRLPNNRAVIEQLIKVANAFRECGAKIISLNFTLICDNNNNPLISEDLKQDCPFLTRGDFQTGRWGHQLIEELAPADYIINKIADSAFHLTHLEWLLRQIGIDTLVMGGLMTNESLASTLRDAQSRGFKTILLQDGCGSYSVSSHEAALRALSFITEVTTCVGMSERIMQVSY
ncbi:MAG: isochorismatase family cysteine hydrolase [Saprospiraceae bacterium]|nr:cysteine hydrolase [Lewinella sp.]